MKGKNVSQLLTVAKLGLGTVADQAAAVFKAIEEIGKLVTGFKPCVSAPLAPTQVDLLVPVFF